MTCLAWAPHDCMKENGCSEGGEGGEVIKQWEKNKVASLALKSLKFVSCHHCVRGCLGFFINIEWCVLRKGPTPSRGSMQLLWSRWLLPPPPLMIVCGAHQLKTVGIRNKSFSYMFQCNQTIMCVYCKLLLIVANGINAFNILVE